MSNRNQLMRTECLVRMSPRCRDLQNLEIESYRLSCSHMSVCALSLGMAMSDVTLILNALERGDDKAVDRLAARCVPGTASTGCS